MTRRTFAALLLLAALQPPRPPDAHEAMLVALHAVEGDSVTVVRDRWEARARRDPTDRIARLGLATLDRLTYHADAAAARYDSLASAPHTDVVSAYASLGLGAQHYAQGRPGDAEPVLARGLAAARAVGDDVATANAFALLALVRAPSEGLPVGFALLDSAERAAPAMPPALGAEILRFRSVLLAVDSRGEAADSVARVCVDVARRSGLRRAEAQCLRSAALNLHLRSQEDSALVVLAEVVRLQRLAHDRSALSETLVRQADVLRTLGMYGEARRALREAVAEAEASHNDFTLGSVYTGLGSLALRLRDYVDADAQLRRSEELFAASGDSVGLVGVYSFRSILEASIGDTAAAVRHARAAADFYGAAGDVSEQFAMLRQLASAEIRARDWTAAERVLGEAQALAERTGEGAWRDGLHFDAGRLALFRGRLDQAEREFERYLAALDSSADRVLVYTTRAHLADIHARRGELARAARELAAANDALDAWRATLPDDQLRLLAFQATAHDLDASDPSAPRVIAALATGGRPAAAFALAERARARTLMDHMTQDAAMRLSGDGGRPVSSDETRQPVLRTTAAGAGDAVSHSIAARMPDTRTALVEYVAGREGAPSTVFVVTRTGVRARALPPADSLADAIARLDAMLERGDDPSALARTLGAILLDPVVAALDSGVTRLVVVPDGPLHRVPFDALRMADGRYVVERFAVSLAPSAGVAAALWERPRADASAPVRLLALGDPTFSATPGPLRGDGADGRSGFDSAGALPRLPASGAEVRAVARYAAAADVRLGDEASAAFLEAAPLDRYRVIHLATHAIVDDRAIGRSAIALAPGDGESGILLPGDLAALDLDADLVVLSACRTAGGVVLDGEGVQGLTAPLLQAGARAVVATGWRIDDRRTVRFVLDFYDALARGLAVGDALREAKLAALRRGAPAGEWAAFTVVGDPTVTIPLHEPPPALPPGGIALVVGGVLGLVGIGVAVRTARRR
ncbi:MAG TPA: CHAT domain-containing tetratricopeptide repeat protein [Gemmatimonadaceae bacterium]|nr:CHAT domain-containing tetratricopeptide repeat protein [Gemmatimonadaceae bacterium]